jgi:hypothetical protein
MTVTPSSSESSPAEQADLESTTTEQTENLLDVEQSLDAMAQDLADDIPEEVPSADDGQRAPSANNEALLYVLFRTHCTMRFLFIAR